MLIANSFLRPHLAYNIKREKMDKYKAVSTQMLDDYFKDVFRSFLLFFILIGPTMKQELFPKKEETETNETVGSDKYG